MHTLYLIAIIAEAMSGALMGMRRGMDRFGLAFVGTVTALGGGTVRDVLFGHHPLAWIAHPEYLVITLVAATLASCMARSLSRMKRLFVTVDALGLAAFAVIGCDIGAQTGLPPLIIIAGGAITGVCGGMLRDLLCNEIPLILRAELYASVALLTGALYLGMQYLDAGDELSKIVALVVGFSFRVLAVQQGWGMRAFGHADVEG